MKTRIPRNMTHAVVYIGAPYGDNEGGHIVSLHKSGSAAFRSLPPYGSEFCVVELDARYERGGDDRETAREYFSR